MESAAKIQDMWQIPYICQFVKLFHGSLNIDLITPEELEQSLVYPSQSPICWELLTKLLLKKSTSRRDLAPGSFYTFDRVHSMLFKQLSSWFRIYERWQKTQDSEKFSCGARLMVRMFEELGGNPFLEPLQTKEETPLPAPQSSAFRETRSQTNSLPRSRLRYADDYYDSDFEEENYRHLGEIELHQRVIVVYYLCLYKLETEEDMLHELKYVPIEQQRVKPIGKDSQGASYYYFNNLDCRLYKEAQEGFSLVAKNIDEVKELIIKLQAGGSYELARFLNGMMEEFMKNEQERNKKMLANIRKEHSVTARKRSSDYVNEDSDFSPIEEDYKPIKRGPGRPPKYQVPERKPKVMPDTTGDELVFEGILKKINAPQQELHSISGSWSLPNKPSQAFKYLKSNSEGIDGVYKGYWEYFSKSVEETLQLKFEGRIVKGCGENMFGMFEVDGTWEEGLQELIGEVELGKIKLERKYLKLDVTDSSCSEADEEVYDSVKPLFKLEFEENLHIEHMRMPLKDKKELKKSLKTQEKRELRRVPFYKSEYLTSN